MEPILLTAAVPLAIWLSEKLKPASRKPKVSLAARLVRYLRRRAILADARACAAEVAIAEYRRRKTELAVKFPEVAV